MVLTKLDYISLRYKKMYLTELVDKLIELARLFGVPVLRTVTFHASSFHRLVILWSHAFVRRALCGLSFV